MYKVKVKLSLEQATKAGGGGSTGIAILFFNLGARWGWVVNATPWLLYPWERLGTHCIRGWVGPRAGLDRCRNPYPHRDLIPGPSSPLQITILTVLSWPTYSVQNISDTWLSCSGEETKVQWEVWITVSGKRIQHVCCSSNDVWCFNLENQTWNKQATTEVKPHSRYGQSQMSLDNRNILIMGNILLTSWILVV